MYQTNFVFLVIFISIAKISTEVKLNSTATTTTTTTTTTSLMTSSELLSSCTYCQTKVCRCSANDDILNCSSYLLNITYASNCAEMKIWNTVDFSSRNLEYFDSTKLLSLRTSHLILKSNSISKIFANTFDSISDILLELDVQMNQLTNISSNWLNSKFTQLELLNLAFNQLQTLQDLDHVYLPNLKQLNLSRNPMEFFPYQINQWKSLIKLDLSFNKLSTIPRFALIDLQNLTWLSLAYNRRLHCIIQDSFKYLKSLTYLDLSSTNLVHLDSCIFIPLTHLKILQIERVSMNCSSCWLSVAKTNSIQLSGQCINNNTIQQLNSLTNQQIVRSCTKSSIDCSIDYCEPGTYDFHQKSLSSNKLAISTRDSYASKNRTIEIILGVVFSFIGVLIILTIIFLIYRWKKGQNIFCCHLFSPSTTATTTTTTSTATKRRHHQKQMIENNPTVIESIITHGANMNISPYAYGNEDSSDQLVSNTKRKLYNPMFTDPPT